MIKRFLIGFLFGVILIWTTGCNQSGEVKNNQLTQLEIK